MPIHNGYRPDRELSKPVDPKVQEKTLAIVQIKAAAQVFSIRPDKYAFRTLKAALERLSTTTGW